MGGCISSQHTSSPRGSKPHDMQVMFHLLHDINAPHISRTTSIMLTGAESSAMVMTQLSMGFGTKRRMEFVDHITFELVKFDACHLRPTYYVMYLDDIPLLRLKRLGSYEDLVANVIM